MENLAKRIAEYIVRGTEHEYEVIKYGVDAILSTGLCFSIALIVCALLGDFYFGILFIIFLTPIKMQFTSYHCKTMAQCIFTYSMCAGTLLLIYKFLVTSIIDITIFPLFAFLCGIGYLARMELNKKTVIYLCIYFLIGIVSYILFYDIYLVVILTLLFEIILILLKITEARLSNR